MKKALIVLAVAALASSALAYNVAGNFSVDGWNPGSRAMTEGPAGVFSYNFAGAETGVHEFKVTVGDWSQTWPGDNAKADFGDGQFSVYYYPTPAADGWMPAANRVGWTDKGLHAYDIMGSFNGWSSPVVTLTAMGGGLYQGDYLVPAAGTYQFKFRKAGDWNIAIGSDFSNYGHDINLTTANPNELVRFKLDIPNGRWQTSVVPEPASLALLALVGLLRRR